MTAGALIRKLMVVDPETVAVYPYNSELADGMAEDIDTVQYVVLHKDGHGDYQLLPHAKAADGTFSISDTVPVHCVLLQ